MFFFFFKWWSPRLRSVDAGMGLTWSECKNTQKRPQVHDWESKQASLELSLITGQKGGKLRLARGGGVVWGTRFGGTKWGARKTWSQAQRPIVPTNPQSFPLTGAWMWEGVMRNKAETERKAWARSCKAIQQSRLYPWDQAAIRRIQTDLYILLWWCNGCIITLFSSRVCSEEPGPMFLQKVSRVK